MNETNIGLIVTVTAVGLVAGTYAYSMGLLTLPSHIPGWPQSASSPVISPADVVRQPQSEKLHPSCESGQFKGGFCVVK